MKYDDDAPSTASCFVLYLPPSFYYSYFHPHIVFSPFPRERSSLGRLVSWPKYASFFIALLFLWCDCYVLYIPSRLQLLSSCFRLGLREDMQTFVEMLDTSVPLTRTQTLFWRHLGRKDAGKNRVHLCHLTKDA